MMVEPIDAIDAMAMAIRSGERRALAKGITLLESSRADHRQMAEQLTTTLLPNSGGAIRVGISGVPGVGKSSFIETLGLYLLDKLGLRLAVLAVDPSSSITGGSILGDKTRMENLAKQRNAFIRPSPTGGMLGGVARKTRESILLCESAGYDVVLVETVGVGQSEIAVANMTDMFCLMQLPNAGDDLQGIKKGVVELADLILVNKADSDNAAAMRTRSQLLSALHLLKPASPEWQVPVLIVSALASTGIEEFWQQVLLYRTTMQTNGFQQLRRQQQTESWLWEEINDGLLRRFQSHALVSRNLPTYLEQVRRGELDVSQAASALLAMMDGKNKS